jgi:hypothetical protein
MDVYLVPVARDRYEPYCEVPDEPEDAADERPSGFISRLKLRFTAMLADAERERRRGRVERENEERGLMARTKARLLQWVAEAIAEQRLLWHLRRQTAACLHYPADVEERHAITLLRRHLGRDLERHRVWLIVDSLIFIASGLLVLVPGPNVLAYYFAFRMVGHFLSMRGARQGLDVVQWRAEQSGPLAELRSAIDLDGEERARRVRHVADALKLEHLAKFFERTAIPSS